jgi:hypothetical protein
MKHEKTGLKKIIDSKIATYRAEGFIASLIERYTGSTDTFSL